VIPTFTTPDGSISLACQDAGEFLRGMEDKSVDLIVTSVPYNKGKRSATSYGFRARRACDSNTDKWATISYDDNKPESVYEEWLQQVMWECLRVSRGVVCLNHALVGRDTFARHPLFLLHPFRRRFWSEIIWDRRGSLQFNARKHGLSHESVFVFGKPHYWNQADVGKLTVWQITPRVTTKHVCQWPLELPKRLIEAYCPPGGLVCDPFAGLATAAVAAFETGRRFIGCDSDPRTYREACKELWEAVGRYPLFAEDREIGVRQLEIVA
jgi:DNA modification methylase